MKADLLHLKKESESGLTRTGPRETSPLRMSTKTFQTSSKSQTYLLVGVSALLVTVLAAVGTWWFKHRTLSSGTANNAIAVLPLQNLNGDTSVDYLRFALADQIANVLTYSRSLDVRPSATTRKYVNADLDPQKVGLELHVATVLSGHFQKQGNRILVALEAIDTGTDKLLWQTNYSGSTEDLIGLQEQLGKQVRQGLLPVLGAAGGFLESSTRPSNQVAYDLYLRSVAVNHNPGPNQDAIKILENAVGIDPKYAPAWAELGQRYYYDATYSSGGEQAMQKSNEALERAMTLDPNLIAAASQLVVNRVDRGEVARAYEEAKALVKRRPESAQSHFSLGYVQRYAGMLEESARQCETALALAPGNYQFRSCAWGFMDMGQFDKAREFMQLDSGSEWFNWTNPSLLLREGKVAEAREAVKLMSSSPHYHRDLMEAVVGLRPPSELERMAHDAVTNGPNESDPELVYLEGAMFAYTGKRDAAFRMLKTAIQTNYCSYSNLLSDPLLRGLHSDRQFDELLTAAHECQQAVQAGAPETH